MPAVKPYDLGHDTLSSMSEEIPYSAPVTRVERVPQEATPLVRIERFCKDFGNEKLWVKREDVLGSWKQRKALYVAEEAKKRGVTKVVVITAGNAGPAIAEQLRPHNIPLVAIIDPTLPEETKEKLRASCYKVVEHDLSVRLEPEAVVALARENPDEVIWDATEGCEDAYKPIIDEIMEQTKGIDPQYIFCPFGQGEAFAGLAKAVEERGMKTTIVGVSPNGRSAFADKLDRAFAPAYADTYLELSQYENGHMYMLVSDSDIRDAYTYARPYIPCGPSSSIVFARPIREHFYYTRFDKAEQRERPSIIINSGSE